jgi:hypothetical protein
LNPNSDKEDRCALTTPSKVLNYENTLEGSVIEVEEEEIHDHNVDCGVQEAGATTISTTKALSHIE